MKTAPIADVKARLTTFVEQSKQGPVVITKNGEPVAVLFAVGDRDELQRLLLAHSPRLRVVLDAGRQQIREGQGTGHEEFWDGLDEAPPTKPRRKKRP